MIKNDWLSIFFIANVASEGIFGLSLMICIANSFTESKIAVNSESFSSGRSSVTSLIVAVMYGSSETTSSISKRFFP